MSTLHRTFGVTTRSTNSDKREVDVVASTGDVDAYGERISPGGWDLARYLANPVVLLGHNAYDLPVGRASNVRVEDGALRATLHIVTSAAHPSAEMVWQSIKQGALRSVSVGFRSLERTLETIGERDIVVHTRAELLEVSLVSLPANQGAVVEATRSLPQETNMQIEKQWHELTLAEKHALWVRDEKKARAMLDAEPTFEGKTWAQLTDAERVRCYREAHKTFVAMQETR